MEEEYYPLPACNDEELNEIFVSHSILPDFITFKDGVYKMKPFKAAHVGLFTVKGELSDTALSTPFSFKIEVINKPPILKG